MADRRAALAATALAVLALTAVLGALATTVPTSPAPPTSDRPVTTPPTDADEVATGGRGLASLHERGLTGENVSVGVVDVTGFDTDRAPLTRSVRAARAFGTGTVDDGQTAHGTAAATVVARTAPDATLYLARVDGIDGYRQAVRWLRREGVDVIVAPVSFYGHPGDGSGEAARVAQRAADAGTVFVAPAGNLAAAHWRGTYDAAGSENGTVVFDRDDGTPVRRTAIGGGTDVTVWLSWDRAHADEDYTAELYWTNGTATRLVARSQPYPADDVPNERIVADVSPGRYFLVVRGPTDPTGARLRLVSPTHEFSRARASGSVVAPGTARGVFTVGAYDTRVDRVEPFSSRGPTLDGRPGVDVVAPDRRFADLTESGFVGSSAAAPYVGAMAALLLEADESLSPRHVELLLELTARDVGPPGADYASGHGLVDPRAAVRAAENETAGG
ncbi:S8 family serine peptidase [Halomicroarcula sp. F13]|uniref:S8 family serine peptidase n=1 Tax=Haloarcula rubra TaxID=2487747 RepID=A0AAW4PLU7_9EURY|nr:S8 family serine peptidase [Halomicroarcula rubra]MBX0322008.1 S8 family serine peptidase [Halomicroarcula rubra]